MNQIEQLEQNQSNEQRIAIVNELKSNLGYLVAMLGQYHNKELSALAEECLSLAYQKILTE